MKKILLFAAVLFTWAAVSAQPNVGNEINYYGVDFSRTKVFGARESGWEFKTAFASINTLVITEWPKYNPGRWLGKNIVARDITPTSLANNAIEPGNVETFSSNYGLNDDDIAEMVAGYEIKETSGTGLVIVGTLLDKSIVAGGFVVVYFDVATRKLLYCMPITGKSGGLGLRNYWAGALYNALRKG
ncbi:MAG: hypothetical protein LBR57_03575 [Alistipes sp.]|jgi:hypothetical protein|nr:hypothetical protein [Alistipes sp.]